MLFDDGIIISDIKAYVADFKKSEELRIAGRRHHSLTFRLSGKIRISDGKSELISEPGCVTFVPKNTPYVTEVLEDGRMLIMHFESVTDDTTDGIRVFFPKSPEMIIELFSALSNRYRLGRERDAACLSLGYELIAGLEDRNKKESASPTKAAISEARELMSSHFSDPAMSVAALAARAGVSEVYFRREFKRLYGMTPVAYLCRLRYDNARAMLKTGYYSVGEVAARCGYSSINYFSSEFKRLSGISPSMYATEHNK